MDSYALLALLACAILAFLVYMMWKEATRKEWEDFTKGQKKEWKRNGKTK